MATRSRIAAGEEVKIKREEKRRGIFARLLLLVLDEHKCSCAAVEEEEKTRKIGCK
jgi:hypothetical protein